VSGHNDTQLREVHQFHSGTAVGDAITNEMLSWQLHLRQLGYVSEVYAQYIPDSLSSAVLDIADYRPPAGSVLLLHHSMGHDLLEQVLDHPHHVVPVFHNITPIEFIDEPYMRKYARIGRAQLRTLAGVASAAIADSNLNRREMLRAGFLSATVLPVKTEFTSYKSVGEPAGSDWLFVGRVVPSKGQVDLVDAFADALECHDSGQHLVLIGDTSDRSYVARLEASISHHNLTERVRLLGKVSDATLAAEYRAAGLYVSMSKHEGFGVPLLEAMAAGLPVVAYGVAAVAETMGGAGVVVRDGDTKAFVQACVSLQTNADLHSRTLEQQRVRLARLEQFDVAAALQAVIAEACGTARRLTVQVQGPFETSYSLATLNRELALALDDDPALDVSIFATEGPGDYVPDPDDLERVPAAAGLFAKSVGVPNPDVVIRQMYPPRVDDSPGALTFQYFGWEESRLPARYVHDFNQHLDGIGVMSSFVQCVLRDSGVTVPIEVVGVGVRQPDLEHADHVQALDDLRAFRFLHISSAFPRKGVDILLRAYFDSFTADDDVSLILKTFPNPHNEVRALLDELMSQYTNLPHLVWIDHDMPDSQIDALYRAASVYVHPARGEGFGLTVAEAMNAGVPVIAPASTGLADFVDDTTATTVPFSTSPALTHLSVPGSMWVEPDGNAVATAMRLAYDHPDDPDVRVRADRARARITSEFDWKSVAARFAAFVQRERHRQAAPHIALVTTWNSRCGIAEYSADLVNTAAEKWSTDIFADQRFQLVEPTLEEFVSRTWIADPRASIDDLLRELDESPAEIVHVQHNYGFVGLRQLGSLIRREAERRSVIVTLHRTEDLSTADLDLRIADIAAELALADRVIVHQHDDAERLNALGVQRTEIIPIGARQFAVVPVPSARQRLELKVPPDMSVIATYGFLLPHKGTLELIQAIGLMRQRGMQVALLAVCALHTDPLSSAYEAVCLAEIERLDLGESVRMVTDFLAPEVAHLLLSTADVVALPYHASAESSSAALRFVLPVGRAVLASDIGIFADASDCLVLVEAPPTPEDLADVLSRLVNDPRALDEYAAKSLHLAHESSLDRSTAEHTKVYRDVLAERASRHGPGLVTDAPPSRDEVQK